MKTCIIGLLLLGLTNLTQGQNNLAYTNTHIDHAPQHYTSNVSSLKNKAFVTAFNKKALPIVVQKMRDIAARFNIEHLESYTHKEKAVYDVVFNEGSHKIEAVYNHKGELMASKEHYKSISLPYSISAKISQENPGWAFSDTSCMITYKKSEPNQVVYKVTLKKDQEKKTVTLSM